VGGEQNARSALPPVGLKKALECGGVEFTNGNGVSNTLAKAGVELGTIISYVSQLQRQGVAP
jgi:hypothetical protein